MYKEATFGLLKLNFGISEEAFVKSLQEAEKTLQRENQQPQANQKVILSTQKLKNNAYS